MIREYLVTIQEAVIVQMDGESSRQEIYQAALKISKEGIACHEYTIEEI